MGSEMCIRDSARRLRQPPLRRDDRPPRRRTGGPRRQHPRPRHAAQVAAAGSAAEPGDGTGCTRRQAGRRAETRARNGRQGHQAAHAVEEALSRNAASLHFGEIFKNPRPELNIGEAAPLRLRAHQGSRAIKDRRSRSTVARPLIEEFDDLRADFEHLAIERLSSCLLYTSDAADE